MARKPLTAEELRAQSLSEFIRTIAVHDFEVLESCRTKLDWTQKDIKSEFDARHKEAVRAAFKAHNIPPPFPPLVMQLLEHEYATVFEERARARLITRYSRGA